ncbi:hypothetical protein CEXT_124401 [Caerostris extrusa]|uniref:Uncharacterized protein n=1 Tax=Caerostris extrusa TaxID=172846 RepID=A0AAV4RP12_CAEEX|nr:hypothetical protein CEXT_124401 [Caerostris extrusa]
MAEGNYSVTRHRLHSGRTLRAQVRIPGADIALVEGSEFRLTVDPACLSLRKDDQQQPTNTKRSLAKLGGPSQHSFGQ